MSQLSRPELSVSHLPLARLEYMSGKGEREKKEEKQGAGNRGRWASCLSACPLNPCMPSGADAVDERHGLRGERPRGLR